MRRFGLPAVDPLPSSMHIVHFYQHGKDLMDVFAQFCCAGLQEGDCCFWLTTPPWTADLALHELGKWLPTANHYEASGQLQLIPDEEWYLIKDVLDVEGTLARATVRLQEARSQGWAELRVCGIPCKAGSESEWLACLQYEQQIHRLVTDMDILALCAYRLGDVDDRAMQGLLHAHHTALSRHKDEWQYGRILI